MNIIGHFYAQRLLVRVLEINSTGKAKDASSNEKSQIFSFLEVSLDIAVFIISLELFTVHTCWKLGIRHLWIPGLVPLK
jgi:hypothetical protein